MFDVGFSELMLIAVVALVVIGPERLPGVARTLGHLFGRLQRYVNDVKSDISREMELDELKKFKNQFEEAAQSVESSVRAEMAGAETTFNSIAADLKPSDPGSAEATAVVPPPGAPEAATSDQVAEASITETSAEGAAPMPADHAPGEAPAAGGQKTVA